MSWIRNGLIALIGLRHRFSPSLLTGQSLPFKLPKLHRPTLHQLVQSRLLHHLHDQPTNQPVQICLVPTIQPHRDRLPGNHLRLLNRNILLLQTCPVPTTLQRSSILASRLGFSPTPAHLQIYLAPALLPYIRLPANQPQHRLGIRVFLQWTQTQIVTCWTDLHWTYLWRKVNSDQDPDMATDPDQTLSEDQTYRET